jgi:hypothetical protein
MVKLWLFADRIGIGRLRNAAVEVLCAYPNWLPNPDLIRSACFKTDSESPLRKLPAMAYANRSQLVNFETTTATFDVRINRDMAIALKEIAQYRGKL